MKGEDPKLKLKQNKDKLKKWKIIPTGLVVFLKREGKKKGSCNKGNERKKAFNSC